MHYTIRLFRDPNPAGGSSLPPSLADLDSTEGNDITVPVADIKSGDGTEEPTSITDVVDNPDTNTPDANASKDADELAKEETDKAEEVEEAEEEGSFWDDVDKLRGTPLRVDYGEVDPESAEGALIREKAVANEAIESFETYLKQTNPRGYAYMLHIQSGGSDEEFFSTKTTNLPEYDAFKESADLQAKLYKSSLVNKGLNEKTAQAVVDMAIKDGSLFEQSDKEYKEIEQQLANNLAAIERQNEEAQANYTKAVNSLNQQLLDTVQTSKDLNLIIPDSEKQKFLSFLKERIHYDNKEFVLVQKLDKDLNRTLEAMYLLYRNGNLKDIIQREVKTQNVRTLKRVVAKSKPSRAAQTPAVSGNLPLGEL